MGAPERVYSGSPTARGGRASLSRTVTDTSPNPPGKRPSHWQSREIAVAVLAGSIFIAASIAAVGLDDGNDAAVDLPTTTTTAPDLSDDTTTTSAVARPSTSTTVVQAPTTTAAPGPTTTAAGASPTTTPPSSCGTGSVRGEPRTGDVSQSDGSFSVQVSGLVVSDFDRPIEVTSLVMQVRFEDGSERLVHIDTGGVVIPSGDAHTYDGPTVTSESQPTEVTVAELSYQPEGRPDCNTAA